MRQADPEPFLAPRTGTTLKADFQSRIGGTGSRPEGCSRASKRLLQATPPTKWLVFYRFSQRLCAPPCVPLRACALVFGLSNLVLLGHRDFLLFRPASRGAPEGRLGARAPAAAFTGEPKKSRLFRLIFSGGPQPGGIPHSGRSRACARKAHVCLPPAVPARTGAKRRRDQAP
jgi:hypothetical protein